MELLNNIARGFDQLEREANQERARKLITIKSELGLIDIIKEKLAELKIAKETENSYMDSLFGESDLGNNGYGLSIDEEKILDSSRHSNTVFSLETLKELKNIVENSNSENKKLLLEFIDKSSESRPFLIVSKPKDWKQLVVATIKVILNDPDISNTDKLTDIKHSMELERIKYRLFDRQPSFDPNQESQIYTEENPIIRLKKAFKDFNIPAIRDKISDLLNEIETLVVELNSARSPELQNYNLKQNDAFFAFEQALQQEIDSLNLEKNEIEKVLSKETNAQSDEQIGFDFAGEIASALEMEDLPLMYQTMMNKMGMIIKANPDYRVSCQNDKWNSIELWKRLKPLLEDDSSFVGEQTKKFDLSTLYSTRCSNFLRAILNKASLPNKGRLSVSERALLTDTGITVSVRLFILFQSILKAKSIVELYPSLESRLPKLDKVSLNNNLKQKSQIRSSLVGFSHTIQKLTETQQAQKLMSEKMVSIEIARNIITEIRLGTNHIQSNLTATIVDLLENINNQTEVKNKISTLLLGYSLYLNEYLETLYNLIGGAESYRSLLKLVSSHDIFDTKFNQIRTLIQASNNLKPQIQEVLAQLRVFKKKDRESTYLQSLELYHSNGSIIDFTAEVLALDFKINQITKESTPLVNKTKLEDREQINSLDQFAIIYQSSNIQRIIAKKFDQKFDYQNYTKLYPKLIKFIENDEKCPEDCDITVVANCICEHLNEKADEIMEMLSFDPDSEINVEDFPELISIPDIYNDKKTRDKIFYGIIIRQIGLIIESLDQNDETNILQALDLIDKSSVPNGEPDYSWWQSLVSKSRQNILKDYIVNSDILQNPYVNNYFLSALLTKFSSQVVKMPGSKHDKINLKDSVSNESSQDKQYELATLLFNFAESLEGIEELFWNAVNGTVELTNGNATRIRNALNTLNGSLIEQGFIESFESDPTIFDRQIFEKNGKIQFVNLNNQFLESIPETLEALFGDIIQARNLDKELPEIKTMQEFVDWHKQTYPESFPILYNPKIDISRLPDHIHKSLISKFSIIGSLSADTSIIKVSQPSALHAHKQTNGSPLKNMDLKQMGLDTNCHANFAIQNGRKVAQNLLEMHQFKLNDAFRVQFYILPPGNYSDSRIGKLENETMYIYLIDNPVATH